jgi:hypothetical protein
MTDTWRESFEGRRSLSALERQARERELRVIAEKHARLKAEFYRRTLPRWEQEKAA